MTEQTLSAIPLIISLSLVACNSAHAANLTEKALQLKQVHFFFGSVNLVSAKSGVKLESTGRLNFVVVAKAPKWNVTVFRNDDKLYFTESLEEFEKTGLVSELMMPARDRFQKRAKPDGEILFHNLLLKRIKTKFVKLDYRPLDEITPPEVERVVIAAYRVATNGGIPFSFKTLQVGTDWLTGLDETGDVKIRLMTKDAAIANVPLTTFDAPRNYKMTKSIADIVSGSNGLRESEDFGILFKK